jgi:hypothetical protein
VLELVIRQDRSYGELSELLGIPEREVRDRAESALRSLAGDPADASVDTGRIADWLLGQQTDRAAQATADSVAGSEPARVWASAVAERLREVGGERVPAVPAAPAASTPAPAPAPAAPRPRPLREPRPAAAAADPDTSGPAPARTGVTAPAASKAGGAVLIGVVVLVLVALLVWPVNLLGLGGDDSAATPSAKAQPTATATAAAGAGSLASQATGNDIVLTGVGKTAKAEGLMRLFKSTKGAVQFAIGAQGVPNNAKGESYAVWFTGSGRPSKLLGFPQTQVTNGVLTVGGPTKADEKAFPAWFATYDKVLITRETTGKPKSPGPVVVQGTLPHGKATG